MGLGNSLQKVAGKLIQKFGTSATFVRISSASYSPTTGMTVESGTNTTVKGIFEEVGVREIQGLIQAGDRKFTIAGSALTVIPTPQDRVTMGGESYQIVAVNTIEHEGLSITYDLYLRK